MNALREACCSLLGAAAALAAISACAESQAPPSVPSQPPPQSEPSTQQPSQSAGESQAGSESSEPSQQDSEEAFSSDAGREAGESAQRESDASDRARQASSESDTSPGLEQGADESASAPETAADGEQSGADARRREAASQGDAEAAVGQLDSGDGARESEDSQQAGTPGSALDRDAAGGAVGGIPIDEVSPELLEAFRNGGSGTQTEALSGDELARALERLAEHRGQVDELIQQEQMAAASEGGDIGEDATGMGAIAPLPMGGSDGQRAEIAGEANESSVSTASTDPTTEAGTGSRVPADVGDGRDDDTLAAQLRELAMNESDPKLRERYWEEYRKHKGIR